MNKVLGFLPLLSGGVLLSWITRILFESSNTTAGSLVAIAICVGCLFAYWWGNRGKGGGHPENLYYMGLLFTLASLVYSLVILFIFPNVNEQEERINNLVGSFGIALISTFVGILLRIVMLQEQESMEASAGDGFTQRRNFPSNSTDAEVNLRGKSGQAIDTIAEAAFKLRMELTQTIADMNTFRKAIQQASSEAVADTQNTHNIILKQIKDAHESLTQLVNTQTERARQALEATARNTTEVEKSMRELSANISGSGERMAVSLNSVVKELQAVSENTKGISVNHEAINLSLKKAMSLMDEYGSNISKSTKIISGSAERFAVSFDAAAQSAPQHTKQLEKLLAVFNTESEKWLSMTTQVKETLVKALDKLSKTIKRG